MITVIVGVMLQYHEKNGKKYDSDSKNKNNPNNKYERT